MKYIIILITVFSFIFLSGKLFADEIEDLIPCIIQVESGGNPNAISNRGAIGLMQLTWSVLREYNEITYKEYLTCYEDGFLDQPICYKKIDLYNGQINRQIGSWYLRRLKYHYLKDKYTIERLLACYNGGYGKLKSVGFNVNKMPHETRNYIKRVMKLYKKGKI